MADTKWDKLKRRATEASQGKWRASLYHWGRADLDCEDPTSDRRINGVPHRKLAEDMSFENAEYCAEASPANIMELLEEREELVLALSRVVSSRVVQEAKFIGYSEAHLDATKLLDKLEVKL